MNSPNDGYSTPQKGNSLFAQKVTRLHFLKQISMLAGALFVGCTPARILLKDYSKKFDTDGELADSVLRAFVSTVIPGAPIDDPNLARIFSDEYYPFHSYCGFFVSDLADRSADLCGNERFDQLTLQERTRVIRDGLNQDSTTARLYTAAIYMAQASFYGGIYDADKGCPFIDFHGGTSAFGTDKKYYPNNARFLAKEATMDGNYK
jgi:hypothetical protein